MIVMSNILSFFKKFNPFHFYQCIKRQLWYAIFNKYFYIVNKFFNINIKYAKKIIEFTKIPSGKDPP